MLSKISAFLDGYSLVHYNPSTDRLIVGNSEGLIKVFDPSQPNSEPVSIDIPEHLTSMSSMGDRLLITNTEGQLALLLVGSSPSGEERFEIVYQADLPLRDSVFINEGNRIACGGDDNNLVITDRLNPGAVTVPLSDQIVNLSYNAAGELLTVALANGEVHMFSVVNEQPALVEKILNELYLKVHTSVDTIDYTGEHAHELISTTPIWSSNGETLYVPTRTNSVKAFSRLEWSVLAEFKPDKDIVVAFTISPSNKSIATLHKNGAIVISSVESGEVVKTTKADRLEQGSLPTSLAWIRNTLYVGSTNGEFYTLPVSVDESSLSTSTRSDVDSLFLDEADESDTEEQEEDGDNVEVQKSSKRVGLDDSMIIDEDDEDEENDFAYYNKSVNEYLPSKRKRQRTLESPAPTNSAPSHGIVPYSPGSTPWVKSLNSSSSKTQRKYLFMNSNGYVWSVKSNSGDSADDQKSITISFFDRTINKDYHFIDVNDFDLCSMNERGVALACSGYRLDLNPNSGKIFYRHHNDTKDSWDRMVPLINGEYITSVCITSTVQGNSGDSIIVVGTNFGYLRFFNLYGLCVNIMKTSPVVTLISSEISTVFVIHQVSPSNYTYSIINMNEDYKFLQQDNSLPLQQPRGNEPIIKGLFFNNFSDPCLVAGYDDSLSILSHWREENNARWVPVLNCKQSVTDFGLSDSKSNWKSWPLGCVDDKFVCLILKNNDSYPGFPLPLPIELDIKLPTKCFKYLKAIGEDEDRPEEIANKLKDAKQDDPEEEFLRASTFGKLLHSSLAEAEDEEERMDQLNAYSVAFDKSLLKLFSTACQDSRLNKAYSVVKLMKTDRALLSASKIAERLEFVNLASKINQLREDLLEFGNEEE
ncbi:CIC11C00000005762 [Sungouiella intermedia]|uniref:CIC11C00000005762 n=1 Tax=Sungouiella intermedia TaxID=45354 RepID=A0A1L0G411_9ASCO|nr:CIC11C00000005762 [[Candida] intermedia]